MNTTSRIERLRQNYVNSKLHEFVMKELEFSLNHTKEQKDFQWL